MATEELTLHVDYYLCESCSLEQDSPVTALIRMIPRSMIMDGKLIGDEFFCCAVCHEPKFHARTRRRFNVKRKSPGSGEPSGDRAKRAAKGHLRLV